MTRRVSSKNKGKKAKRKNSVKKRDQTEKKKKNGTKKQKTASPGVETGLSARSSNYLTSFDHCTRVTHMIGEINFVISKQFFSAIDAV